ncbi:MAG: fibronectin type III domain-containing protein, partial [Kiritimatiellae bacterium]|nr:fibronectin type III domain-containing protein [Kiritimatiellia bacterium]
MNQRRCRARLLSAILCLCVLVAGTTVAAATLTVGDGRQYSAIAAALRAASNGARIEIYGNSSGNRYRESIDADGLDNITLIGMLPNQAVVIDGTGVAELGAKENVRLSSVSGWRLENLTFKEQDNSAGKNLRIGFGAGGHTITKCRFSSGGTGTDYFHEIEIRACPNNKLLQNVFDGARNKKSHLVIVNPEATGNVVTYNKFAGSGVYYSIKLGTSGSMRSSRTTIAHNYFCPTMDDGLSVVNIRDSYRNTVSHNLFVPKNFASTQAIPAVRFREDATDNVMEHNTIMLEPGLGSGENGIDFALAPDGKYPANPTGTTIRNNIIQGGYYCIDHNPWDSGNAWPNPAVIRYNFLCKPDRNHTDDGAFLNYAHNTESSTAPGFVEAGVVWRTDGTAAGTISEYYALAPGAPAATAGENSTHCGAFGIGQGATIPTAPTALQARAAGANRIELDWQGNSTDATGFKIDRRQSGTSEWIRIAQPGANATSYADTGLLAATRFDYKIKAYNGAGDSAYSNIAWVRTGEPGIPKGGIWRHFKGASEASAPAHAWRQIVFDDSAWSSGPAPIGYSDYGVALGTELADMPHSYSCVFLRSAFRIQHSALVSELRVWAQFDDGFIMWLNGEEIARVNVAGAPGEFVPHDAVASGNMNAAWSNTYAGAAMPVLCPTNVLAVQVFNRSLT